MKGLLEKIFIGAYTGELVEQIETHKELHVINEKIIEGYKNPSRF